MTGHFMKKVIFLEGTGSMVVDHENKIIYACLSPRTHKILVEKYAQQFGFKPIIFSATDHLGRNIYHTNVLMCIGNGFAVTCTEAITDEAQRNNVLTTLKDSGHQVITISLEQMHSFAGNMLQLINKKGLLYC